MLATGYVKLQSHTGETHIVRTLFDDGSEINIISEQLVRLLKLKKEQFSIEITGVTGTELCDSGIVAANIKPWFTNECDYSLNIECLVMKNILGAKQFHFRNDIPEFNGLLLADPDFNKSSEIHMLLGVEVCSEIAKEHIVSSECGLKARATDFGYLVAGSLKHYENVDVSVVRAVTENNEERLIDQLMSRFWEMNDSSQRDLTIDEERAQTYFRKTVAREPNGRFIVRIPFIEGDTQLGDSAGIAMQRYQQLERRFSRDPDLRQKYNEFMREYINLGHMRLANKNEQNDDGYFIPHHAVTKRFRVVFDASCNTTNGKSMNDIQLAGANLQEQLGTIIMRFRMHKFVISADIKKMFRQFKMHMDDQKYQKIFFRFNENDPILIFILVTVTYGFKCSPFLSLSAMKHLAELYADEYPLASFATLLERYMDDYYTGGDSIEFVKELYHQLRDMLAKAGLELAKWKTNSVEIAELINNNTMDPNEQVELSDEFSSVLGLKWIPSLDCFVFNVNIENNENEIITKRVVLRETAKLYDPDGYLAPIIVVAKMFIQHLWSVKLNWDEELCDALKAEWSDIYQQLSELNCLRIPRWLQTTSNRTIELIGFADASKKAYGAAIYLRVTDGNEYWCSLLTSKSKVAPLKTVSIPRLELCAAELLAILMNQVIIELKLDYVPYFLFTDSMITLHWIRGDLSNMKTFVSNRVAAIQRNSAVKLWFHVPTNSNPADFISRGLTVRSLVECEMWWRGPEFLYKPHQQWPGAITDLSSEEMKEFMIEFQPKISMRIRVNNYPWLRLGGVVLLDRYDNLAKIVRITAYFFQAIERMKGKHLRDTIGFSNEELNNALDYWIKYIQMLHFASDLQSVLDNGLVQNSSRLIRLKPFIDESGILRMWGRITNANISYDERHPIIIPAHSQFSKLIMFEAHSKTGHGSIQDMMHYVQEKYWVIQGKRTASAVIKSCIICIRRSHKDQEQLMGDLPAERLTIAAPFTFCGVDHFGPIYLQKFEGRCKSTIKCYAAIFVCMTTRMVHIELCSDLTTERFIQALSRMASIYGVPERMFSDNGRTFVGAENELKNIAASWQTTEMRDFLTKNNVQWKFICPKSPFRGGLWEASVKSAKYHLSRIIGNQRFTFERYQTILYQVAAIMNSRPLTPLSNDPLDLNYLTPAHAHKGNRVIRPLCRNLSDMTTNKIKQSHLIEKIHQDFWTSWRKDYLSTLQTRYKWNSVQENLKVGDFVIVKENNLPPNAWCVARIIETFPGKDNLVRTVKIRTAKTDLIRPVQNLVRLPILDEDQMKRFPATENIEMSDSLPDGNQDD